MSIEPTHQRSDALPVKRRARKRGQGRLAHKRGQGVVEYILICALVVGGFMAFRDELIDPIVKILAGATTAIRVEATRGGERKVDNFYAGSCSKTDRAGGCQ